MKQSIRIIQDNFFIVWLLLPCTVLAFALFPVQTYLFHGSDKLLHGLAFASLIFWPSMQFQLAKHVIACAALLFLFGAGVEAAQSFIPTRQASVEDIIANSVGIALGLTLALSTKKLLQEPTRQTV